MEREQFEELSAGHALHALDAGDEVAFQDEARSHPEWDSIVIRDVATVGAFADAVSPVVPPPGLRAALLERIRHDTAAPEADADPLPALIGAATGTGGPLPTETIQTVARRSWTRGILALAASMVLLAVVGFGSAWLGGHLFPQSAETVAMDQIERAPDGHALTVGVQGGGEATAYWAESVGQAVLVTDGVATLAADQTYELWLVRDGTPLAAGLLAVGSDGSATMLLEGAMQRGDSIAVTVEPAGGSLDGTPSTDPVVVIPTGSV